MQIVFLFVLLYNTGYNLAYTSERIYEHELREIEGDLAALFKTKSYTPLPIKDLKKIVKNLGIEEQIKNRSFRDTAACLACRSLIWNIKNNKLALEVLGRNICRIYVGLTTLTVNDFCGMIIEHNKPILQYIVENSKILDSELACSVLLQNRECYYRHPELTWTINIPEPKGLSMPRVKRAKSTRLLKVLHLSDLHVSTQYEVGGVSDCGYPLCCLKGLGNPYRGKKAGKWGDYRNCDVPVHMFLDAMNRINSTHKDIDFIYFTGDIMDHRTWKSTVAENTETISYVYKVLKESFPGKLLFPSIGNHETSPLNVFPPPSIQHEELSQNWLYNLLSTVWKYWLPDESLATVNKQGYYSYLFNNKLRIIVLNNNVCYIYNWWVLYNTRFLMEQLNWLRDELMQAEESDQFVHIISHVPPGNSECIEPWEVNYNALVKRFSNTITGQFYGHTHTDELKIFYEDNGQPINVGFNGASLTPYSNFNPNYKIMWVDPNTYKILDIDTYIFNLTQANLNEHKSPNWFKLYSMKEAYDLRDLNPSSIQFLTDSFSLEDRLFNKYYRFFVRDGDTSLQEGCDENCKNELITKILTSVSISCITGECQ